MVVLDKLTYAGRRENLEGVEHTLVVGGIEDPVVVREAMEGADAVVNFAAESHVDRSIAGQDPFALTHVIGTGTLLDAARELGVARYLQVSTDEVYGSIESRLVHRDLAAGALVPLQRHQGRRRPAGLRPRPHPRHRGGDLPGVEQLRAAPVPREADPAVVLNALHGDSLPVYGDGRQVRNWLYVEDFARAIALVLEKGRPGEAYNVGGPDECENIEVVRRILGADRPRRVADRARDRPQGPRPPLLALLGQDPRRAGLAGQRPLRRRPRAQTVHWYRDNEWWWEPIRSASTAPTTSSSTAARWARRPRRP